MAPTPNLVNKLFKLLGPDGIDPNLKRRLQSILQYPPESEPSRREVKKQWMGIIERRRVEHQLMVTEELQRLVFELNEIFKSGENDTLGKNLEPVIAFLLALHTPPGPATNELAREWQKERETRVPPETQAERDARLYQSIIEEQPFEGDHWQTDIYAGSSSSYSGSIASSDWNSSPENEDPSGQRQSDQPNVISPHSSPVPDLQGSDLSAERLLRAKEYADTFDKLKKTAYWLKPDSPGSASQVPELIAVREVLAALHGLGGDLIFSDTKTEPDKITLAQNVPKLLSQSQSTSLSIFNSFVPLLSSLKTLRTISHPRDQSPQRSTRTQEALVASLRGLLQRFDRYVTSIELTLLNISTISSPSNFQSSKPPIVVSLLRLSSELDSLGWTGLICKLGATLRTASTNCQPAIPPAIQTQQLLENLYRNASWFDSHSNSPNATRESRRVFLETFSPVWSWIGHWMLDGRLPGRSSHNTLAQADLTQRLQGDPSVLEGLELSDLRDQGCEEFFIRSTEIEILWTSGDWWDHGHVLRTEVCSITGLIREVVPDFLEDLKFEILEGGKARALSNILQFGRADRILRDDWPSLEAMIEEVIQPDLTAVSSLDTQDTGHLLRSFLLHHGVPPISSETSSPIDVDPEQTSSSYPAIRQKLFKSKFAEKLEAQIQQCHQINHQHLHLHIISPSKLSSYLIAINDFFLHTSLSASFFLNALFEDLDGKSVVSSQPLKKWWDPQVINHNLSKAFELSPGSPIKLCLPKVTVNRAVRRETNPIKCLNGVRFDLTIPAPLNYILDEEIVLESYNQAFVLLAQVSRASKILNQLVLVKSTFPFASLSGKTFEQQPASRAFYKLKNRLSWFVNMLMDYFTNLVVHKWTMRVVSALEELTELGQKVGKVREWIKRLRSLMFLSEEARALHRIVMQLFGLCYTCSEVWTAFNLQSNSLAFMSDVDETSHVIESERRRRRGVRWQKRLEKEQYTLMEQIKGRDEEEGEENDDDDHQRRTRFLESSLMVSSQESFEEQFDRMNFEFENLLGSFRRALGSLGRKPNHQTHSRSGQGVEREEEEADEEEEEEEEEEEGIRLQMGEIVIHEQEDLECLMLLECRLDEWIT